MTCSDFEPSMPVETPRCTFADADVVDLNVVASTSFIASSTRSNNGRATSATFFELAAKRNQPTSESNSGQGGIIGDSPANESLTSLTRRVVISSAFIGGTLVLALLIFVFWRRRRGFSCSTTRRLRSQTGTTIHQSWSDEWLAACPNREPDHFSLRSSRRSSVADLQGKLKAMGSTQPTNLGICRAGSPVVEHLWDLSTTPELFTSDELPIFLQYTSAPPQPSEPQQAIVRMGRASTISPPVDPATIHGGNNPPATSPPRTAAPHDRMSQSGLSRTQSVTAWLKSKNGKDKQDGRKAARKARSISLLKNQALPPVLAPASAYRPLPEITSHG